MRRSLMRSKIVMEAGTPSLSPALLSRESRSPRTGSARLSTIYAQERGRDLAIGTESSIVVTASASANLVGALVGAFIGGTVAFGVLAYYMLRDIERARRGGTLDVEPKETFPILTPRQRLRLALPIYLLFLVWSCAGVATGAAIASPAVAVFAAISLAVAGIAIYRLRALATRLPPRGESSGRQEPPEGRSPQRSRTLYISLALFLLGVSVIGLVLRFTGHLWGDALFVCGALALLIQNLWHRRQGLRSPS